MLECKEHDSESLFSMSASDIELASDTGGVHVKNLSGSIELCNNFFYSIL